jgi:hypothetical protein
MSAASILWRLAAAALTASLLIVSAACGRDSSGATTTASIAETEQGPPAPPPQETPVTAADIGKTRPGSAERAFLDYWSALQYSAWSAALAYYEPGLVRAIDPVRIVEALKGQASYFPTTKPKLRGKSRIGPQVVVRYSVTDPSGRPALSSITWKRSGGKWRIHYQPFLDAMLRSAAQSRVQAQIDPNATQPSEQAVRAGAAAAQLQSQYLRRSGG